MNEIQGVDGPVDCYYKKDIINQVKGHYKNLLLFEMIEVFTYIIPFNFCLNLRLEDTYAARHMKIRPPLHVCLNNLVARPSFKILSGIFGPSDQGC